MANVALYRKYRPKNFDEIICQNHITTVLKSQIETGEISHAYLFCGSRGTGKTSTALVFARAITCTGEGAKPCGKCPSCISSANNVDIIEIDAASNNGVNEIRELRENVKYAPLNGKYKVYIIDEVHMLSDSAFNALLKTLEEPPKHAIFILATTEPQKLPATILSRCIRFNFRLLTKEELANHLKKVFDLENIKYEETALNLIAEAGEGSVRDTLTIADMVKSYCKDFVTYDKVVKILSVVSKTEIFDICENIVDGNSGKVFEKIITLTNDGKSINVLAKEILTFFRNLYLAKNVSLLYSFMSLSAELVDRLKLIANKADAEKVVHAIYLLSSFEQDVKQSTEQNLLFESLIIKLCFGFKQNYWGEA